MLRDAFRVLLHTVLRFVRFVLYALPFPVRLFVVRTTLSSPLWFSRFMFNLGTWPIGDDCKWMHKIESEAWRGYWIVPDVNSLKQAEDVALNSDLVVLYVHGGGYCRGCAGMYMEAFRIMLNHLRSKHKILASILSLEYSLSPEHVWPKACDETMEAYKYLTDTLGVPSSKIIFGGDSAGANLVAVTILATKTQKYRSQPAGAVLLSPWIDLTVGQPSSGTFRDDFVTPGQLKTATAYYIPNYRNLDEASRLSLARNPLISPLFGDFRGACPMFIGYGEKELLRTSAENFKLKLEKNGVSVTTFVGQNAPHEFLIYSLVVPTKEAFERDCKVYVDWMASIINGSSKAAKP